MTRTPAKSSAAGARNPTPLTRSQIWKLWRRNRLFLLHYALLRSPRVCTASLPVEISLAELESTLGIRALTNGFFKTHLPLFRWLLWDGFGLLGCCYFAGWRHRRRASLADSGHSG